VSQILTRLPPTPPNHHRIVALNEAGTLPDDPTELEAGAIAAPLPDTPSPIRLGLGANWRQFALLVVVNAFVGAMVGLERTVVPLIAQADFGLVSKTVVLSFLVSFGIVKALANLFAGQLADRIGRKPLLVAGWLAGLPVPLLIIWAPSWGWIVFANVLLGVNQGLCWSTTVIMKIDLVGPARRGLAMGLNEFAGYVAVSLSALLTGYLAVAHGLRPTPFYPGIAFAMAGLLLSVFAVRDTHGHARVEARQRGSEQSRPASPASSCSQAGGTGRCSLRASRNGQQSERRDGVGTDPRVSRRARCYARPDRGGDRDLPLVWGMASSPRRTERPLGTEVDDRERDVVQAVGIATFVIGHSLGPWLAGAILLGIGTALVYPTLLAAVSDVAHPDWRASAVACTDCGATPATR